EIGEIPERGLLAGLQKLPNALALAVLANLLRRADVRAVIGARKALVAVHGPVELIRLRVVLLAGPGMGVAGKSERSECGQSGNGEGGAGNRLGHGGVSSRVSALWSSGPGSDGRILGLRPLRRCSGRDRPGF